MGIVAEMNGLQAPAKDAEVQSRELFFHAADYRGTDDALRNLLLQVPEDDGMKALGISDHDSRIA
ncbi:MAG: hypothetical protein KHY61_09370 [Sutterella wadsworthensis]|nr:hypothetical protein [Sutterella wadsworthensis]